MWCPGPPIPHPRERKGHTSTTCSHFHHLRSTSPSAPRASSSCLPHAPSRRPRLSSASAASAAPGPSPQLIPFLPPPHPPPRGVLPELRPSRLPSPERHRGAREPSPRRGAGTEVRGGRCKAHTGAGRRCGAHALSRAGHKLALVTSALVRARHVLGTAGWALLREEATTMVFQRSAPCPQQQRLGSSVERRPGAQ